MEKLQLGLQEDIV